MKTYILLPMGITGMGGGQMYVRNRMMYLKRKGCNVYIYSGLEGSIILPELEEFKSKILLELSCSPFVYTSKFVKTIINRIRDDIEKDCIVDDVIIESYTAHMAYWGEIIAEYFNGRNLVYLLDERNDKLVPKEYLDYFSFKFARHELAGINKLSLKQLFRESEISPKYDDYSLPALCQNVTSDEKNDLVIEHADLTIGRIGRLDKPYVDYMLNSVIDYCSLKQDKMYNLVLIGGAESSEREKQIIAKFSKVHNINLYITGFLFPIPLDLINSIDIFISSAGSAGVSYRAQKTTISLDAKDGMPIGVLGYTTMNSLYRGNEEPIALPVLLKKILEEGYLNKFTFFKSDELNEYKNWIQHENFWRVSEKVERIYYPVMDSRPTQKDLIKWAVCQIMGCNVLLCTKKIIKRIKRK